MTESVDQRPPELDSELTVCGDVYFLRRSLGLMRRIEQRFGALAVLADKADRFALTLSELSGIIEECIRGAEGRPTRADIERWLFDAGIHAISRGVAKLLFEMTLGSDKLRRAEEERRLATEDRVNPTRPAGHATPQG